MKRISMMTRRNVALGESNDNIDHKMVMTWISFWDEVKYFSLAMSTQFTGEQILMAFNMGSSPGAFPQEGDLSWHSNYLYQSLLPGLQINILQHGKRKVHGITIY